MSGTFYSANFTLLFLFANTKPLPLLISANIVISAGVVYAVGTNYNFKISLKLAKIYNL